MTSLAAVLAASIFGSLHCVAMCGPLAALHLAPGARATAGAALAHAGGRLLTYVTLGALAGVAGGALDLAADLASVQRVAALVAGAAILAWGVVAMTHALWPRVRAAPRARLFRRGLVHLRSRRPAARAAWLGVLTGLLPCGWLWAFVVIAAGTASPLFGAAVMATFWLGTVPAMLGVTTLAAPLVQRLRTRLPVLTAATLMALGVLTLAMRWDRAGAGEVARPTCHDPGSVP